MARNEQLIRQLKLLQLLESSRYGLKLEELRQDLVQDMGLSKLSDRTVRRDLEALQAAGFDVDQHESQRGSVWKIGPSLRGIPKLQATATELLALSMVRDLLVPLSGTPFWQGVESLWTKMRESLPEPVWKHFNKRRKNVLVVGMPQKSYAHQEGILATINRAILQNRVIEIEYQSGDESTARWREVEPYAVVYYRGSLYVVAVPCQAEGDVTYRHYKLDRFKHANALDRRFKPRSDFNAEEHFGNSMGIYTAGTPEAFRIRLAQHVVAWVAETPWHAKQRIEPGDDGHSELFIPSAYAEEIIPRVLALGAAAEVLEPVRCRDLMASLLSQLQQVYGAAQTVTI